MARKGYLWLKTVLSLWYGLALVQLNRICWNLCSIGFCFCIIMPSQDMSV